MQSGAPLTSSMERAVELAERATELAGVSSGVDDLRDVPVDQILAVQQQVEADGADRTFVPAVDGRSIPTAARPCAPRRVRGRASRMLIGHERRRVEAVGRRPTRTAATSTRTGCGRGSRGSSPPTRSRA